KEERKQKVIDFFILFLRLFVTIFIIYSVWEVPLMTLIPIVIIGWTITLYIYKRRIYKFKALTKDYFFNSLKNQTYQVSLMLSIGALLFFLNQIIFVEYVVGGLNFLV